ncbi:MAG: flagellar biosynthesis protein FlhB [Candidatus Caldatribacteriaceae bacterium]
MPLQEKTEAPTPRKREELRRKGQIPFSVDFIHGFHFLFLFTTISFMGSSLASQIIQFTREVWLEKLPMENMLLWAFEILKKASISVVRTVMPVILVSMGVGLALGFLQSGFLISFEKLKPKFDYINPLRGLGRLFSLRTGMEFLKVSLKAGLGIFVAYAVLRGGVPILSNLTEMEIVDALGVVGGLARKLGFTLGGLFLGIGFFDLFYQRFEYERSIRMTKEEVKEEYKRTEGDPVIRSRIRTRQREIARRRMMQEVPKAQVVVTNPVHIACALRYERGVMRAPVLVAKGKRLIAEKIKEIARRHGVPIVENKKVAWELFRSCDVGQEIPGFLYKAVAEILAFVYRLNRRVQGR